MVVGDTYCSSSTCYASNAGTYDLTGNDGSSGGIAIDTDTLSFMLGVDLEGGDTATCWMDSLELDGSFVYNVSLALVDNSTTAVLYPDGRSCPLFAGCLGLGVVAAVNQSFGSTGNPDINASLVPGYMWELG